MSNLPHGDVEFSDFEFLPPRSLAKLLKFLSAILFIVTCIGVYLMLTIGPTSVSVSDFGTEEPLWGVRISYASAETVIGIGFSSVMYSLGVVLEQTRLILRKERKMRSS
ncbi:MAG: hypothetical protein RLZZ31_19 [Actinomycetota bacterium]